MASYSKFYNTVQYFGTAQFNFGSDTLKVLLTNTAPVATNSQYSDISAAQVANGNGYTTGGSTATIASWTNSTGTSTLTLNNVTITASGGTIGPFRYAVLYDSTSGKLLGYFDYGSSITLNSGDTFSVAWNGGGSSGTAFTIA